MIMLIEYSAADDFPSLTSNVAIDSGDNFGFCFDLCEHHAFKDHLSDPRNPGFVEISNRSFAECINSSLRSMG